MSADLAIRYLKAVFGQTGGFVAMAAGFGGHFTASGKYDFKSFAEDFYAWPDEAERIVERAMEYSHEADIYVCPVLRSTRSRKKGDGLPARMPYADVDLLKPEHEGFTRTLVGPNGLVVDSGGPEGKSRHVYLGDVGEDLDEEALESLNRQLGASLDADSGWSSTKYLRLPGTLNHKGYARGGASRLVRILPHEPAPRDWTLSELARLLPDDPGPSLNGAAPVAPATPMPDDLPPDIAARLREEPGEDRSVQLWDLVRACLECGYSDGETLALALEHEPTKEKYGDRASIEIERAIGKWRRGLISLNSLISQPSLGSWPTLDEAALYGLAGDIVRTIAPQSEADPVALLVQLLVAFGSAAGRGPHFTVEADRHGTNLYTVLIGATSKGRKGTSWSHVSHLIGETDTAWSERNLSGLSSGEGLIYHIRDQVTKDEKGEEKVIDEGVSDKRMLVSETEFASVLRVLSRDGSTLSPVIRRAWDGQRLQTLTRNAPLVATDPHVSIVGHITVEELQRHLDATEAANGFGNRFVWILVRRSQFLSRGGSVDQGKLAKLAWRLESALKAARRTGQVERDEEAFELWDEVYQSLSKGRPGLVGALTSRGEAQTLRLAMLYALLDGSSTIRAEHLRAGLALWHYSEQSTAFVFGDSTGNPDADTVLRSLRNAPDGLTRTEISNLFSRHTSAPRLDRALGLLLQSDLAHTTREETDGRPVERWFSGTAKEAKKAKKAPDEGVSS